MEHFYGQASQMRAGDRVYYFWDKLVDGAIVNGGATIHKVETGTKRVRDIVEQVRDGMQEQLEFLEERIEIEWDEVEDIRSILDFKKKLQLEDQLSKLTEENVVAVNYEVDYYEPRWGLVWKDAELEIARV